MTQFDDLSPEERKALNAAKRRVATFEVKAALKKPFKHLEFPAVNAQKFREIEEILDTITPDTPRTPRQLADLACQYFNCSWGCDDLDKTTDAYALMAGVMLSSSELGSTGVELANRHVVYTDPAVFAEGAYSLLVEREKMLPSEAKKELLEIRQAMVHVLTLACNYYARASSPNLWKDAQRRLIEVSESIEQRPDICLLNRLVFMAGSMRYPELLNRKEIKENCRKALRLFDGVTEAKKKIEMIESVATTIDAWNKLRQNPKYRSHATERMPAWLRVLKRRCDQSLPSIREMLPAESISKEINQVFGDHS